MTDTWVETRPERQIQRKELKRWREILVGRKTDTLATYLWQMLQWSLRRHSEMEMETQILAHLERSQVKSTEAGTLKSRNRNSHMLYVLTLLAAVLVGGSVEDASRKTRSNMYIYVETKCPQNCLNFLHHRDGFWQFSLVPKGKFVMLFWALCYELFGKWCTCCVK